LKLQSLLASCRLTPHEEAHTPRLFVCSVCQLAFLIGEVQAAREERAKQLARQRLVLTKMDAEVWQSVLSIQDSDGLTVDKFGFVFGMLIKLDLVEKNEIGATLPDVVAHDIVRCTIYMPAACACLTDLFSKLFDKYENQYGNGKISRTQLKSMASEYHKRASAYDASRRSSIFGRMGRKSSIFGARPSASHRASRRLPASRPMPPFMEAPQSGNGESTCSRA
jgi:hypothetical protein